MGTRLVSAAVLSLMLASSADAQGVFGGGQTFPAGGLPPGPVFPTVSPGPPRPPRAPSPPMIDVTRDRWLAPFYPPPMRDVFRARRDTYVPHPNPWLSLGYVPGYASPFVTEEPWDQERGRPTGDRVWVLVPVEDLGAASMVSNRPTAPAPTPTALPPAQPGPPRTFYVIPGCYAGDVRPRPDQLRAGCQESRLRVIPPRSPAVSSADRPLR